MVDTIYIENGVFDLARTEKILARYPAATIINIDKYSEVFNPHTQNFRIQKQNPALILAKKNNKKVLPTPVQYEAGGGANYYFSHMLNCPYDCRYCFLQGMYRSANFLLFVNYEDFAEEIRDLAEQHRDDSKPAWFFSGYDCDSLAYEPVTHFAEYFIEVFNGLPNAVLELRTKSTQIRSLLNREPLSNVVVAYSLSPTDVASAIEIGAPSFKKRLQALVKLQKQGWRLGLRFDPIIWHDDYQSAYQIMIDEIFSQLDADKIDSVTLGGFRLPKDYYKTLRKLYPEHGLFSAGMSDQKGMVSYEKSIESEMLTLVGSYVKEHVGEHKLYSYPS